MVTEPNYIVMDTDYATYSVVYGCEEDGEQNLWILSRTPTMDADTLQSLYSAALARLPNYVSTDNVRTVVQGAPTCTGTYVDYYPTTQ